MSAQSNRFSKLIIVNRQNKDGDAFKMKRGSCTIGRDMDKCDIKIHREGVSLVHALINTDSQSRVWLKAIAPVEINGMDIPLKEPYELTHCDLITICGRSFRFEHLSKLNQPNKNDASDEPAAVPGTATPITTPSKARSSTAIASPSKKNSNNNSTTAMPSKKKMILPSPQEQETVADPSADVPTALSSAIEESTPGPARSSPRKKTSRASISFTTPSSDDLPTSGTVATALNPVAPSNYYEPTESEGRSAKEIRHHGASRKHSNKSEQISQESDDIVVEEDNEDDEGDAEEMAQPKSRNSNKENKKKKKNTSSFSSSSSSSGKNKKKRSFSQISRSVCSKDDDAESDALLSRPKRLSKTSKREAFNLMSESTRFSKLWVPSGDRRRRRIKAARAARKKLK